MKKSPLTLEDLVAKLGSFDHVFYLYVDTNISVWSKSRREYLTFESNPKGVTMKYPTNYVSESMVRELLRIEPEEIMNSAKIEDGEKFYLLTDLNRALVNRDK